MTSRLLLLLTLSAGQAVGSGFLTEFPVDAPAPPLELMDLAEQSRSLADYPGPGGPGPLRLIHSALLITHFACRVRRLYYHVITFVVFAGTRVPGNGRVYVPCAGI